MHESQIDCNKITQMSRWVGVSFKWETPTPGQNPNSGEGGGLRFRLHTPDRHTGRSTDRQLLTGYISWANKKYLTRITVLWSAVQLSLFMLRFRQSVTTCAILYDSTFVAYCQFRTTKQRPISLMYCSVVRLGLRQGFRPKMLHFYVFFLHFFRSQVNRERVFGFLTAHRDIIDHLLLSKYCRNLTKGVTMGSEGSRGGWGGVQV